MNKLNITLHSLANLIDNLQSSILLYRKLKTAYPDSSDIITPLTSQANEFKEKLQKEYKRLSQDEYISTDEPSNEIYKVGGESTVVECLRAEANLINAYSESMHEDVLWEVLPVFAKHLTLLKNFQQMLIDNIEHINHHDTAAFTAS